jgi:hypothetical protein
MKEQEYSSLSKLVEGFIKEHDTVIAENLKLRQELITAREIEIALSKENLKLKKEIEELRAPPHSNEIARRLDLL